VLVVEDDDPIRTMLLAVLDVAGYEVRGATNGPAALRLLEQWRPHVIVLDPFMRGVEGHWLFAQRAAIRELLSIPVIAVTTRTSGLLSARQLGVRAVLQRPHDVQQLLALIAEAIHDTTGAGPT
jgi:CheY-like chemotaxis protein